MKEGVVNEWIEVFHDQKSAGKVLIRSTFTVDDSKHIQTELNAKLHDQEAEIAKLKLELEVLHANHIKETKEKNELYEKLKKESEHDHAQLVKEKEELHAQL